MRRVTRRRADLSHTVVHGEVTYPGMPAPVLSDYLTREASRERYAPGTEFHIGRIEMIANTGTYLDTPAHRYADGHDLSELPLERVAGVPGIVLDDGEPLPGDVAGHAVLVRTGWDQHWATERYGDPSHPSLSVELGAGSTWTTSVPSTSSARPSCSTRGGTSTGGQSATSTGTPS